MIDFQCKSQYDWEDFLQVMALLRGPGGCPWDAEQTHASIRRNFLEETYEALDALDRDDPVDMCEELGDVLMQVAFHAQIETERGRFTMAEVVDGVTKKLVYRHPHVFGTVQADTSDEVLVNWEVLKRQEKGQQSTADAIEAVPHTLPALWRAEKVQKKTAKAGFDWSDRLGALRKLEEEVRELRQAVEAGRGSRCAPRYPGRGRRHAVHRRQDRPALRGRSRGRPPPRLRQIRQPLPLCGVRRRKASGRLLSGGADRPVAIGQGERVLTRFCVKNIECYE